MIVPFPPTARAARRLVLHGLAASAALALLPRLGRAALPNPDLVKRVQGYLNQLETLQARFTQTNPNGSTSRGTVWLERPDRIRFDYDRPSRVLIVARDGRLTYWDPAMSQLTYIGVEETPLGILLRQPIDLETNVEVLSVREQGGGWQVVVRQRGTEGRGVLGLDFADDPLALTSWTVVDPQGLVTRVVLSDVKTGMPLDRELFVFRNPRLWGEDANEVR